MSDPGQENKVTPLDEGQQELFGKRIGQARIKAREQAKAEFEAAAKAASEASAQDKLEAEKEWQKLSEIHANRVAELEPFEAEAKVYREMVTGMLKDRVKALGDKAKKAVGALPESMSDVERLAWLNANEELFGDTPPVVGTPAKKKKLQSSGTKSPEELGHRRLRL